eukprot:CAMPEP_0113490622 /NCGR_PEP_ID=MMETSP0014_2-20120614/27141_1 /TAXON_ID=2857 /ORGANISM="Nitzschia sp." /LENGTH=202 /DNA_ID=CAMNT_0000384399 /DNA_START=200 /DNA_END=808 /DNA_ORIENTATION=- /assembly_acc=CAM_ASM_000159
MINRTVYTPLQKYMVRKAVAATAPKAAAATAPAAVQATTTATNIFRPSHVTTTTTTTTTGDEHHHVVYTPLQMYDCRYHNVLSSSLCSSYSSPRTRSVRMMSSMSSSSSSSSSSYITGDEIGRRRKEEEEDQSSTPTSTSTATTKDVSFSYYYPYLLTVLHSSLNEPSYEQQMLNLTAPTLEDNQVLSRSEIKRLKANLCCL